MVKGMLFLHLKDHCILQFSHEEGGNIVLRKVGSYLPVDNVTFQKT